jgi:ADP-heptose:LPS heptosyltransferase
MNASARGWDSARRVLCVRLDNLGDVLMTTPALAAIQDGGRRRVTLLASSGGAALAPYVRCIDDVIEWAAPWMKATACLDRVADLSLVRALARRRFDAAVIFTVHTQSALPAAFLCHLAGIPLRLAHCRENPYGLLTDWLPEREPALVRHEVQRQLDLVSAVGYAAAESRLVFRVPAAARVSLRRRLASLGINPLQPFVVAHPGATAPSRRYPAELFGEALREVRRNLDLPLIVTGVASEAELCRQVARGISACHVLAGELDLGELGALIERAAVLVSNNTAPVHLASALGTPVVDLYALTNPQHTPWQVPSRVLSHDVPCRGCCKSVCPHGHHRCLRGVAPADVMRATLDLVASAQPLALSA